MAVMELLDGVADLVREVSATVIVPRFRALEDGEVTEKAPGDVVTAADTEAERLLREGLERLLPGAPVVGEEAGSANPSLLNAVAGAEQAWLVDPLDGTTNFVSGSTDWGTMVALVRAGRTTASWMWHPTSGRMYRAELGSGAWCDETRLVVGGAPMDESRLVGAVLTRFLDESTRVAVARNAWRFGEILPGRKCAAVEYPDVICGDHHFALYWRTLPWDHAPGTLLLTEAGGVVRRPDGTNYLPGDQRVGLLVARNATTWHLAIGLIN